MRYASRVVVSVGGQAAAAADGVTAIGKRQRQKRCFSGGSEVVASVGGGELENSGASKCALEHGMEGGAQAQPLTDAGRRPQPPDSMRSM